jgi:hypothetical protein
MNADRNIHVNFKIKLESIELDFKGWLTILFQQRLIEPLVNLSKRPETWSIKRNLVAKQSPYFDKLGY